jgi:hypothetical protein
MKLTGRKSKNVKYQSPQEANRLHVESAQKDGAKRALRNAEADPKGKKFRRMKDVLETRATQYLRKTIKK